MIKIDFIKMLAEDAQKELEHIEEYNRQYDDFKRLQKENPNERLNKHPWWKLRVPSKAKIKDNMKMIRRLALEITKEEI